MGLFDGGGFGEAIGGIAGGILGGVGSIVGAGMSGANAAALIQANYEHQKEFAQNGIRWRVADAQAAGLHPLAALGAQTPGYTPSAVVGDSPDFSFLRDLGQDIGRAVDAKSTAAERAANKAKIDAGTNLDLEGKQLDNEYKRTLIASQKQDDALRLANAAVQASWSQQLPPAMPGILDLSMIPGQGDSQMQIYPNGRTRVDVSEVPTTLKGDPSTQAGAPPDSRFYITSGGRAVLPNEATGDVLDAVPGAGIQYAIRNSVIPYLANFLPIDDPRRRDGEYYSILTGDYRKGGRFRDFFGY